MCFCLAGTGVTARNSVRIYEHVADSNFVTSHSRRICDDLKELAERTVVSVSEKVHSILNATDADLETIQAPDAALLEKYPAFGRRVEEMLRTARTDLESIEVAARGAREDATRRGYI
jgi:pseudouridine-5'-phosphate glycosidase